METYSKGKISQIIGAVVDVTFEDGEQLPNIYDALKVKKNNGAEVILECQHDIGENTMRTIAMDSTDGLRRGMKVRCLGAPISMPTGEQVKGRLFNAYTPSSRWFMVVLAPMVSRRMLRALIPALRHRFAMMGVRVSLTIAS